MNLSGDTNDSLLSLPMSWLFMAFIILIWLATNTNVAFYQTFIFNKTSITDVGLSLV